VERLENKLTLNQTSTNELAKMDQSQNLERAQMQRKIMSLENQLRFQTNLNLETKKEIQKLDGEITTVADNCSQREQILQTKLEEAQDMLRQERLKGSGIKSEML
jgi:hypothetical protein